MKKQLTILLIFLQTFAFSQPRFLYVKDGIALDVKEAMEPIEKRFDFLFDKYGKWQVPATQLPTITLGKSDSLQKVYMIMTFDEFTNLNVPKFINWALSRKELIPQFVEGGLTDYGKVRSLKYHEPGNYTINAWQPEYVLYFPKNGQNIWRIPESPNASGCKCSFQDKPEIGDYVEIPFNGTGIKIIGEKVFTHGIVNVELDGQYVAKVDQYAPDSASVNPFTIYEVNNLPSQQHVVKIEVVGKNLSATNYYFVLHRFEVTNKMSLPQSEIVYDTVYVQKTDTIYIEGSENNDIIISNHTDIKEAYEKATGLELTRDGYYQLMQRPDSSLYIRQPNIKIK